MDRQTKSCTTLLQRRCCGNTLLLSYLLSHLYPSSSTLYPLSPLLLSAILTLNFHLSTLYSLSLSSLYPPICSPLLSFCSPLSSTPHSPPPSSFFYSTLHTLPLCSFPSTLISPLHPLLPTLLFTSLFCISLHYTDFTVFVFVLVLVFTLFLHSCSLHLAHLFSSLSTLSTPKQKI